MKQVYLIFLFFTLSALTLHGQEESAETFDTRSSAPTLYLGVGTLSYFGELNEQGKLNSPLSSKLSYSLGFRQKVNNYLEYDINLWTGTISANERTLDRNLNFETGIFGFGVGVVYNFGNFLKEGHVLEPVLGVGVEMISYSAKTDLYDQNGIYYNYWSDGTIRNVPEDSDVANESVVINRDYHYESDIKTSDLYGLEDHNTFGVGIPITVGANLLISDQWTFRAALIYHFTNIDLFDGIDPNSGNFKGDDRNDRVLHSSISIAYNFKSNNPRKKDDGYEDFSDFFLDMDQDQDSINDFEDDCLDTPLGAEVDSRGCALDGDKDNVPNWKDQELFSARNAQVDSVGVTITDANRELFYVKFYDETGNYSPIDATTNTTQVIANKVQRGGKTYDKTYAVAIGEFNGDIPSELVNDILSLPDVNTYESGDNIVVAVGRYTTVGAAISRQKQLEKTGVKTTDIIAVDDEYQITDIEGGTSDFVVNEWENEENNLDVIYRIQIGAFSKEANESKFAGVPQLVKIQSDDGYIRYYSGLYTDYNQAAKAKIDLMIDGYPGCFVVVFKGGNVLPINNLNSPSTTKTNPASSSADKGVKFRVQIGSFKNEIPTKVLEQYMELKDVEQFAKGDNSIRYVAGSFDTYEEATEYKNQLRKQGYDGCYVVGSLNGAIISAKKAMELTK